MDDAVAKVYGNKVRVRACGLAVSGSGILMVNHKGITPTDFWAPPGGGVEFGQSIFDTLRKEFIEETGLHVKPGTFLFGCEYIAEPIHSIELFYSVEIEGGKLRTGKDPEIQIIREVRYMEFSEIKQKPPKEVHGVFRYAESPTDLEKLKGFYRI